MTHDYGKTVGWQFAAGRDFSTQYATDTVSAQRSPNAVYSIIVNEAAVRYMGLKNPVGEFIKYEGLHFQIIGVIKNMLMESPFEPVKQMVYIANYDQANTWMTVRLNPTVSMRDALSKMETTFKHTVPSVPFDYKFADTEYGLKFAAEERVGKLASVFATLAILISCLGLFGLASFMAEKRTKEIGVRKVLGASVLNVWGLLSKDFVVLVLIAFGIATVIAYYFLSGWLQKYSYHTEISWWIFAVSGVGALLVTLLTVSYQSIKAALLNPVKSLRNE
ncbi:FtsX-like permease family protein [Dyadobacter sp. CY261]|uniref:ABC transporter permease n=1 Tax=Dyadobacter sp. CY261 TaxID=2907203 RepID=UPI00286E9B4E|nr:FtsX-like permease family protein [Dyadobacter sp. CY261]